MDQHWINLGLQLTEHLNTAEPLFKNPNPKQANSLLKITESIINCQAILETLASIANPDQPALEGFPNLEMQALASEGSMLLEAKQLEEDNKNLDNILKEVEDMGGFQNIDKENPKAQELANKTKEIYNRNTGESEAETLMQHVQTQLEKRIETLTVIKESKKILQEKFEEELSKLESLIKNIPE